MAESESVIHMPGGLVAYFASTVHIRKGLFRIEAAFYERRV